MFALIQRALQLREVAKWDPTSPCQIAVWKAFAHEEIDLTVDKWPDAVQCAKSEINADSHTCKWVNTIYELWKKGVLVSFSVVHTGGKKKLKFVPNLTHKSDNSAANEYLKLL